MSSTKMKQTTLDTQQRKKNAMMWKHKNYHQKAQGE